MGSVTEISQPEALRLQLAMIAGGEPRGSYFELRWRRENSKGMGQDFISVREAPRAARAILNRGQMGDVYVGAAPRARELGTAAAVERLWALWADCDTAEAVERLRAFRPLPSVVIRSGSDDHLHAWWPLCHPTPPDWAQRANRRLALALGADRAATDAARIMRPVGSLNHKTSPPRPVTCVRLELDAFEPADIVSGLPDDPAYLRASRAPSSIPLCSDARGALAALARTVREAPVGKRNHLLHWAACRARERLKLGELDDNEARELLRDAALDAGLDEFEADATLRSALANQRAAA